MATIRGTKDFKRSKLMDPARKGEVRVVHGASDPRQIRCPGCGNLAVNQPNGRGGFQLKCAFCNRTYDVTAI